MARDPVKVSKNLDDNAVGNAIFTSISDGTDTLLVNGDGSLNATINNASIVVTATDLDIRDIDAAQDNIAISDGTDTLAVNADGSINSVVTATNLDIRDLAFATDKVDVSGSTLGANSGVDIGDVTINNAAGASAVNIQDGGNSITVDGSVSITGSVTVTATDLDIRDLTHVSDSVKIGDGTDFLAVNADGSINVVVGASSGTPVADYNQNATLASATSSNHDYTATGGAFLPSYIKVSSESIATFEILTGPTGTLVSRGKIRTSVEHPNAEFLFPAGFSIASTEIVRVIRTNDSNKTHAVNSTIEGSQL